MHHFLYVSVIEERDNEKVALITIKNNLLLLDLVTRQKVSERLYFVIPQGRKIKTCLIFFLEDDNIKTYNITAQEMYSTNNDNHEQNEEKITPPVVLYTDVIKQSQQHNGKPSARLSKYNFLAQMFTQMKESYSLGAMVLAQDSVNDRTQQNSPSEKSNDPLAQNLEKNSVRDQSSQLNPYQMNHFYPINQDRSTTSTPLPESGRESTTTVGTLHAPLLKNNGLYPPRAHTKPKTRSPTQNKRSDDASEIASNDKSTNAKTVEKTESSRPYNFI